jgi:nitrite reductase/ring-hydroxylating ferredoxin subunit/multimeric flavodoxin WrbA
MADETWRDLGPADEFKRKGVSEVRIGRTAIAVSFSNDRFGAISGVCNHAGGPLGQGRLEGDYIVCPWHNWKYHFETGAGEPGYEDESVPRYDLKEEGGRLFVRTEAATKRHKISHPAHPLERPIDREPGATRVLGISTTAMDAANPRFSTSDALLECAVAHASAKLSAQSRILKLNDLKFRSCEGYYSKSSRACTWPCSITQMDSSDQMDQVYEGIVFWADVILISTPIRWGSASSLYYKMVERMNCVQNQVTLRNRVLLRNKVAAFIITGGQDNIQAVAGQLLGFFAEIGCLFPQFPYIAHSRGWSAEDMENNIAYVKMSQELKAGAEALAERAVAFSRRIGDACTPTEKVMRAGRKADGLGMPVLEEAP